MSSKLVCAQCGGNLVARFCPAHPKADLRFMPEEPTGPKVVLKNRGVPPRCRGCKFWGQIGFMKADGVCRSGVVKTGGEWSFPARRFTSTCEKHTSRNVRYCPVCELFTDERFCPDCRVELTKKNDWMPRRAKKWGVEWKPIEEIVG